jgi:hypothetical protein
VFKWKDAWNASDITLESVPESKAIAETVILSLYNKNRRDETTKPI